METRPACFELIDLAERGDKKAADALFATLYSELRRVARYELARHGAPISVGTTTLIHQAYIHMAGREGISFADRKRFLGYAARVMRGLVIDHARSRSAQKRGGQFEISSLETQMEDPADPQQLAQISDALDALARAQPGLAEVVDLKFFCGLSFAEIAALREVSERTIQRDWEKARIYLHRTISVDPGA